MSKTLGQIAYEAWHPGIDSSDWPAEDRIVKRWEAVGAAVQKAVTARSAAWARHPVDVLAELLPDADPERLAEARAMCDAPWTAEDEAAKQGPT